MYKTIQQTWPKDNEMPDRTFRLSMLRRVLDGSMYDQLKYAFADEYNDADEYIPMSERRPSVRTNLCRTVVDDSVALLFSESNFPSVELNNETQKQQMKLLLKEIKLNEIMVDAATQGSVGSIAIMLQVLGRRVFLKVLSTTNLTPTWNPKAPDVLLKVTEKYKVSGSELKAAGYSIADADLPATYWFQREWDDQNEIWFSPWKVTDDSKTAPKVDKALSVSHKLGFVPVAWIKNLPGGDDIDGKSTFQPESIDCQIECDYQLSQAGRGLKFMSDPTLVIKDQDDSSAAPRVQSASNALTVGERGDAKLLEIDGTGVAAVIDYVKHLREIAIETMHGNRASNEKIASVQSGRAMELMNQALIWLADKLRISYGEGAIIDLVSMIVRASKIIKLQFKDGSPVGEFDQKSAISLRWPSWFAPTHQDKMNEATTLSKLCDAGLLSRLTAIKILADKYDIEDADAEKALADADMVLRNKGAQIQAKISE